MELTFRFATPGDVDLYFKWVNEPTVRQNSFNQEPILYENHVKWFDARLKSEDSFLYLFFNKDGEPVGQVRIERGNETIVDVSVDKQFRGRSYAEKVIRIACIDFLSKHSDEIVTAYVKHSNVPSYRAFLKAGFEDILIGDPNFVKLQINAMKLNKQPLEILQKEQNTYSILRYDYADETSVSKYLELFYACFGYRAHLDEQWFKWFYLRNPFGLCNNYLLWDTHKSVYAGAYALSRANLISGKKRALVGVGVNGMVHPGYRNQGLYGDLISVAVQNDSSEAQVTYLHGNNRGTIKGHLNAGWRILKTMNFYAINLQSERVLSSAVKEIKSFVSLQQPELFVPIGYKSYMEKTAEWLDWRFLSRPHKTYSCFGYFDEAGKALGYMILSFYKSATVSRCQIADYNALNKTVLEDLLKYAKTKACDMSCDVLDLWLDDTSLELNFFSEQGFTRTDEFYELLVFDKEESIFEKNIKTVLADLDAV